MNRIHRTVWSEARQAHVVAHEKAAANGKPSSSRNTIAAAAVGALMLVSGSVHAGPCLSGGGVSTVSNGNICDAVAGTSVNFQGTSGTAYVISGYTITGATAANNAATNTLLNLINANTVTGAVGTATNMIGEVKASQWGGLVAFQSDVFAYNLTLVGQGAAFSDTANVTATINGSGNLTFYGTSTVTGTVGATTTIGTLKAGATGKTVTFSNDVNATTVEYTGTGSIAMNGSLAGNVDFKNNAGTFTLATAKNLTGNVDASTGSAGTLVLSGTSTVSGTVGATNALTTINAGANGSTATFSSNVAATNLIYTGSGTVNMNGNFTGTTQLAGGGGILNVAAGKNVGAVTSTGNVGTVNFAGSTALGGHLGVQGSSGLSAINFNGGTVTTGGYNLVAATVNVNNAAILKLTATNTTGVSNTIAINNTATLDLQNFNTVAWVAFTTAAGSTIKTAISSATPGAASHGYVSLTAGGGIATVASGTTLTVAVDPAVTLTSGTQYKIIDTSVASTYGTLTVTSASSRYRFKVISDPQDLIVQASLADYAVIAGVSSSALEYTATTRLNDLIGIATGPTAGLLTYLDGLSATALATEVKKLAPTTSMPTLQITTAATSGAMGTVSTRLAALRGDVTLADAGGMTGMAAGSVSPGKEFWVNGFGGVGKQAQDNGFDGYKSSGLGLAFGYDRDFGNDVRAGAALSYADSKVDIQDARSGDWTKAKSYQITAYGHKEIGAAYVEGSAAYGVHKFDTLRATPNATQATGSFDASQWTLRVGGGLRMEYGAYKIIPMAGLTYSQLTRDAYTESGGGGAALVYSQLTSDLVRSDIGVRFAGVDETAYIRPELHFAWLHDFNSQKVDTVAAFSGGGTSFTTPGQSLGRDGLNVGGGVTIAANRLSSVTLTYDYLGRSGYAAHTGQIVGNWKF